MVTFVFDHSISIGSKIVTESDGFTKGYRLPTVPWGIDYKPPPGLNLSRASRLKLIRGGLIIDTGGLIIDHPSTNIPLRRHTKLNNHTTLCEHRPSFKSVSGKICLHDLLPSHLTTCK